MEFAEKRKDTEYITANKRISLGLCTKVATEELGKIGGKVTKKRHHYCCYDQQSTRIMAEGIQPQIGKSVSMNNCAPITVQDLNNVSFRSCKAGEDPKKNNCFPANKFAELTDAFMSGAQIGMDEAVKGVIDSMFNLNEATQQ
ncbi:hypothetical protein CQA49_00920 [Helicobacter sp. MIT 00-7814]|nr:hypothetical protein CQA37_04510 [Helicobacter sp. MIT 99-10781]RDU56975.1 hypothetical protein CQA49_00920 [Helicobacter sp. MIT 00-7814]